MRECFVAVDKKLPIACRLVSGGFYMCGLGCQLRKTGIVSLGSGVATVVVELVVVMVSLLYVEVVSDSSLMPPALLPLQSALS